MAFELPEIKRIIVEPLPTADPMPRPEPATEPAVEPVSEPVPAGVASRRSSER